MCMNLPFGGCEKIVEYVVVESLNTLMS
jgi:hypothetical protein